VNWVKAQFLRYIFLLVIKQLLEIDNDFKILYNVFMKKEIANIELSFLENNEVLYTCKNYGLFPTNSGVELSDGRYSSKSLEEIIKYLKKSLLKSEENIINELK
jgi:hypothetical protein